MTNAMMGTLEIVAHEGDERWLVAFPNDQPNCAVYDVDGDDADMYPNINSLLVRGAWQFVDREDVPPDVAESISEYFKILPGDALPPGVPAPSTAIYKFNEDEERNYHGEWTSGGDDAPIGATSKNGASLTAGDVIDFGKHGRVMIVSNVVHPRNPAYRSVVAMKTDGTKVKIDMSGKKVYPIVHAGTLPPVAATLVPTGPQVNITKEDVADLKGQLKIASARVQEELHSRVVAVVNADGLDRRRTQAEMDRNAAQAATLTKNFGAVVDARINELVQRESDRLGVHASTENLTALRRKAYAAASHTSVENMMAPRAQILDDYTRNFNNGMTAAIATGLENLGVGVHDEVIPDGSGDHDTYEITQKDIDAFKSGLNESSVGSRYIYNLSERRMFGTSSSNTEIVLGPGDKETALRAAFKTDYSPSDIGMEDFFGGKRTFMDSTMMTLVLPDGGRVPTYDLYQANKKEFGALGVRFSVSNNAGMRATNSVAARSAISSWLDGTQPKLPNGVKIGLVDSATIQQYRDALVRVQADKDAAGSTEIAQRITAYKQSMKDMATIQKDVTFGVLGQLRPLGSPGDIFIQPGHTSGTAVEAALGKELIGNAAKYLPSDWIEASNLRGGVQLRVNSRSSGRSFNRGNYIELKTKSSTLSSQQSVAIHEMMHRIESVNPDVSTLEEAYWKLRAPGQYKTKNVGGGKGDPDTFKVKYSGRYYGGGNWEIGSMGMQGLHDNSAQTRDDPDYKAFMLGLVTLADRKK
jgi:hypothetical protein